MALENESNDNNENFRYLFYGEIGIGKGIDGDDEKIQKFKLLLDTGSCEMWVMSKKCIT